MENKIGYIVVSSGGSYSDAWHNNISIHLTKDNAEQEVAALEEDARLGRTISLWIDEKKLKFEIEFKRLSPEPHHSYGNDGRFNLDETYLKWHRSKAEKIVESNKQIALDAIKEFEVKEGTDLFESLTNYMGYLSSTYSEEGSYQIEEVDIRG